MARIECWFEQDLKKPVKVHTINGNVFSLDHNGTLVGVKVFDNGSPATLSGTVNAYCILADGTTVPVSGTRDGNTAYILMPQSALAVPGIIKILIKLTDDSVITTLAAVVSMVYQTQTDNVITPSSQVITDWSQQIAEEMQAVEDASAIQDAKIDDLKSAFENEVAGVSSQTSADYLLEQGLIKSADGSKGSSSTRIRTYSYIKVNNMLSVTVPNGMKMNIAYYGEAAVGTYIKMISWFTGKVNIQPLGAYCKLVFAYDDDSNITPSAFANSKVSITTHSNQNESIINAYDSGKRYKKDDIVLMNNDLYSCKENGVTGTWDGSKWEKAPIQNKIFADIRNYIDNDSPTEYSRYRFDQGGISSDTGLATNSSTRIRSYSYIPVGKGFHFAVPNGMKAIIAYYGAEVYTSYIGMTDWTTSPVCYVINPVANYCRILFAYTDDSSITPSVFTDERITISKYKSLKEAFTQINRIFNLTRLVPFDGVVQGAMNSSGSVSSSTKTITFGVALYVGAGKTIEIHLKDGWDYSMLSGSAANKLKFKLRHVTNQFITLSDNYVAFNIARPDPENEGEYLDTVPADFDDALMVTVTDSAGDDDTMYDPPESLGQLNCVMRAKQATSIAYVTAATLPNQKKDYPAGTNIRGVPYSSTRYENNYVPNCISFDSFMTAAMNPNSYLYTRIATAEDGETPLGNSKTYFGSVCSSFVSWCLGFDGIVYTTHQLGEISGITELEEQNCYALKLGDVLLKADDHVVIVTEIARTKKGKIKYVEISEAWPPFCRSVQYTIDGMQSRFFDSSTGYKAYRYDLSNVDYTPSPWVNLDDETGNPVYNELLSPRRGDKANWLYGETVEIDILDSQDYTHYKLYKNDTLIATTSLPQDLISLSNLDYGEYKLCMTDGNDDSDFVYWIVIATPTLEAEYIGNKTVHAVFGCQNAEAMSINWCRANHSNLRHLYAVFSATLLTAAEKSAGEATNTYNGDDWDTLVSSDSGKFYINIKFKTKYGIFSKDYVEISVT